MPKRYLRVLLVMVLSYIVVLVGTMAVVDTQVPLARNYGPWLLIFALMAIDTVLAARLFRNNR
ncbi:MAG: hypothetical protein VW450_06775 [Chloroflexota bacterium]